MTRYIIVSIISGILFGILDGIIYGNAFAQKLFYVYLPIARETVNIPAGMVIDLAYGLIMARIFLILYDSLPGSHGLSKGISFALIIWFFRVVMYAISQWMTIRLPEAAFIYIVVTGLIEMMILGILYGKTLQPQNINV